ncbi:hypothetical protein ACEQ8H_000920 [Pleosporales sp. CAS-2024a]
MAYVAHYWEPCPPSAFPASEESSHGSNKDTTQALALIDNVVEYLQWTTWKDCGTCPDGQICYIPIWPMGTHEDHKHPRCRTADEAQGRFDY